MVIIGMQGFQATLLLYPLTGRVAQESGDKPKITAHEVIGMRITIGQKLIGGFMIMAILVVVAGAVGFIVLGKVARSADIVAKEKTPVRYAVMNAALSLRNSRTAIANIIHMKTHSDALGKEVNSNLSEFFMWIAMIEHGTDSTNFKESPAGQRYKELGLMNTIPQGSAQIRPIVAKILQEGTQLDQHIGDLITAQRAYTHYTFEYKDRAYEMDDFLNLAQRRHLEWVKKLKDAVNIETKFTGYTEPNQGIIGEWLDHYKVNDTEFMTLLDKFHKQFIKLRGVSKKINAEAKYKDKVSVLNRGIGATARMDQYFQKMHAHMEQVYAKLKERKQEQLQAVSASARSINVEITTLIDQADKEMETALNASTSLYNTGRVVLLVLTVIAAVIALLLGVIISRMITSNVRRLGDATKKVASGDLKEKVQIQSGDEIGDLAQDTNQMIEDLRGIISQIRNFAESLTDSSKELADISGELDANAGKMSDMSGSAVQATEQMNNSMESINTTSKESMSNVTSVASAIEEMTATISEISANAGKGRTVTADAVSQVNQTSNRMSELGSAAEAIGKVVEMIMDISEQTNLLALNATIEAARAGDAGKGFAVVASEVKELARQANEASEDIRQKTAAIQSSSKATINEIQTISKVIQDVNAIVESIAAAVEEQAVTTKQISENVHYVANGIEGVTGNVTATAKLTREVVDNIGGVNQASQDVGKGSAHIRSNSKALAALANELQKTVEQFKI